MFDKGMVYCRYVLMLMLLLFLLLSANALLQLKTIFYGIRPMVYGAHLYIQKKEEEN
jgi:hypothetical protein